MDKSLEVLNTMHLCLAKELLGKIKYVLTGNTGKK